MFHSKQMNFPLPGHANLGPMAVVHVHARNSTLPYFEMSPPGGVLISEFREMRRF